MDRHDDRAQIKLDLGGKPTAGDVLARIRRESRDESEKGRWFEQLFMRLARQEPEFEIGDIQAWAGWPDRDRLTGLDGRDIGIDLVASRADGDLIAVQCKCYDEGHITGKRDINSFLTASQRGRDGKLFFSHRWIVGTCGWGPLAQGERGRPAPARRLADRLPGVPAPGRRRRRRRPA